MKRIALVTCREFADLDPDDRLVIPPLTQRGIEAVPAVWDDPAVDWSGFDLAVLRSPWDYTRRRDEFVQWAAGVPRLLNPADVVEWNTDKRYLADLAAAGAPVVPTVYVAPGERWDAPTEGQWVIKPAVSAGSVDTGRYDLADPSERELAYALMQRLHEESRTVMVQPYLDAVDSYGETALIFIRGQYSHAIRKGPMLDGPYRGVASLYKREEIVSREPSLIEREVADTVLAASPFPADQLLYARVDLIGGPDQPVLVELEVTEPSLFLRYDPKAPERLADAIAAELG